MNIGHIVDLGLEVVGRTLLAGAGISWVESRLGLVEGRSLEEGSGVGGGLVPCLEACQVQLAPFGSCCFSASAGPVLKQGRMSVVVGGGGRL